MPAHEFAAGRLNGILHPWSIPPTVGHHAGPTLRHCSFAIPVGKRPCRKRAIGPWTAFRSGGRAGHPGRGTARSCRSPTLSLDQARNAGEVRTGCRLRIIAANVPSPGTASARKSSLRCVLSRTRAEACRTRGQRREAGRGIEGNPQFRPLPIDLSGIGTN